ncbi:uncharacterized protein PRCAT00000479001 [Priceomyces carsonii]|uniref:uncharacterized protein n=1 Tax=Priceomyces carsonii TaxID=28549 RepID=UPI002EDB1B29|nr:unnamed protein product [Priceomyces carsonii]
MAPPSANGNLVISEASMNGNGSLNVESLQLETLLLRDDDIFQSTFNSEDYMESLAPVIKNAIKTNGLSELIRKLNDVVKDKDEELNEISLDSTQDIDSCINNIDEIHEESYDLNRYLQQVSQALNKSVYELITSKKNLIKHKEVTNKINETIDTLNLCTQVLEITNKIHELIKQKKYFSALKLIDELTSIHLPKVDNFSFAVKIYDSIPHLTKMIKDEAFENLCKWLSLNLERKLLAIGEVVWENLYQLQERWDLMRKKNSTLAPYKVNSPIELSMREPGLNYVLFEDENLQLSLSTVYDAILVYQTMKEIEILSNLYHKEWLKKYNRIIYPITLAATQFVADFPNMVALNEYLRRISAFFLMDKEINLSTRYQLRSNDNSNDLWESYITKLKPTLLNYLKTHKLSIEELTEFKDIVGNFVLVMESKNYRIIDIYEVLIVIFRDYFAPALVLEFRQDFIESMQSDHYMPLVVTDKTDYDNIIRVCWYPEDAPFAPKNVRSMPISFPFSEDYVHYCLGIRSLLEDVLQFVSQHYSYELSGLSSIIINNIFERMLGDEKGVGISHDIRDFIEKNSNNKEITAQSYTNLEYYVFSLYRIGELINHRLRKQMGVGIINHDYVFTLRAVEHFNNVKKFSEAAVFKMVDVKIRELLETVEYENWEPEHRNKEANYSIKDFALFLENLFTSIFSNLPSSVRTLGLFRTYDFVAEHFLEILKNADRYNRVAIENFNLDIKHLEKSMAELHSLESGGSSGQNVALETTFTELRQCIDLLLLDNYEDFKNPSYRMRHFDRLKYEDGLNLISKMHDESEKDDSSIYEENMNTSAQSLELQSALSNSAAMKFAKFSSRFKKNNNLE